MGSSKVEEACKECKYKCFLTHGKNKKHPSSHITSFFKIMIGNQFSNVLYFPPKFSRTLSDLVGQNTRLENSSGRQWGVTISKLNGSLAFKTGWHDFSLDNELSFGDFVVFHYVTGSHFFVQIYERSGCEKLDFGEEKGSSEKRAKAENKSISKDGPCNTSDKSSLNKQGSTRCKKQDFGEEKGSSKKRVRTEINSITNDGPCHTSDKSSLNRQGSIHSAVSRSDLELNQSECNVNDVNKVPMATKNTSDCGKINGSPFPVCKPECIEEPYYMIDRDLTDREGKDRSCLFDLSNYEMHNNISVADQKNKLQVDNKRDASLVGKDRVDVTVPSRVGPSDASHFQTTETNKNSTAKDQMNSQRDKDSCNSKDPVVILPSSDSEPGENGDDCPDMSNKVIKKCRTSEQRSNTFTEEPLSRDNPLDASQKKQTLCSGGGSNVQQKVTGNPKLCEFPVPSRLQNCQNGKKPDVMKGVQDQSFNLTTKDNDKVFKVVKAEVIDQDDLSLPTVTSISCFVPTTNRSYLELPSCLPSGTYKAKVNRKVVLLQDPDMRRWPVLYHERRNLTLLTNGWEAFRNANSIQPGDECVFEIANEPEGIYVVRVIRRF